MGCLRLSLVLTALLAVGCGHTASSRVGLASLGDLEGRVIAADVQGPELTGKDCAKWGFDAYTLADAVRNALEGTEYDTLVDLEVESTTGLFMFSNCIEVTGRALSSGDLAIEEEEP